jgi:transcription-repair coupling factor (superfamily II helicase)
MIPEDYVPDLAVRMALYRRMNDAEGAEAVEALAAEMIDRFGPLPGPTQNLLKLIEIKRQAIEAHIAKIDVGRRARWSRSTTTLPRSGGAGRLCRTAEGHGQAAAGQQAGDQRAWGDAEGRSTGWCS